MNLTFRGDFKIYKQELKRQFQDKTPFSVYLYKVDWFAEGTAPDLDKWCWDLKQIKTEYLTFSPKGNLEIPLYKMIEEKAAKLFGIRFWWLCFSE